MRNARNVKNGKTAGKGKKSVRRKQIRLTAEKQLYIIIGLLVVLFVLILAFRQTATKTAPAGGKEPPAAVSPAERSRKETGPKTRKPEKGSRTQTVHPFFPAGVEIPRPADRTFVLSNQDGRYTLLYDTTYRQAAWVAYLLTGKDVKTKGAERRNRFAPDPQVLKRGWRSAGNDDYLRSGYDKGHLLPSADRNNDRRENDATFLFSNIAPQRPALNRKIWNALEAEVRRAAERFDTVYVVTGGHLKPGLKRIGREKVGVPERFFKVLLARSGPEYLSIGFLIPNRDSFSGSCWDYAVPVDEVERETGLDFFHLLPDSVEARIESRRTTTAWRK